MGPGTLAPRTNGSLAEPMMLPGRLARQPESATSRSARSSI